MPSRKKTIHYSSSALVTSIAVGVLGYGLSAEWAKADMDCARTDYGVFNGTALVIYKFFNGNITRTFCPSFGNVNTFDGNVLKLLAFIIIII